MYKTLARFFSEKLMIFLLVIYAISMAMGTFIENIYSTDTAKNIIYESKWFECIMLFLAICLIISINTYKLWSIKKLPLLIFHISFIIILFGACISRYFGFEGMMLIRKGQIENKIISDKTYIKLNISKNNKILHYNDKYLFSKLHHNYNGNFMFYNQIFNVKVIKYIPYAIEAFFEKKNGKKTIKIVTIDQGSRIELFIQSGNVKRIGKIQISFNKIIKNAINILYFNKKLYIISPFNGYYLKMNTGEYNNISKNIIYNLKLRSLYNINGYQLVFPDGIRNGDIKYISTNNLNKKNFPSAITAIISTKNKFKIVTFLGDRGILNMNKSIFLDGKKISIGYGSILLKLPFYIYLKNFILKKYPGSDNPSYFSSEITLIDNNQKKNYNIYMNNILHYKGYKFFQSGYDSDGNGTKLSVNHDDLGSNISYIGYLFLTIGMFFTLFWKGTRFSNLRQRLIYLIGKSSLILLIFFSFLNIKANNSLFKNEGLNSYFKIDKNHSEIFGNLLVQDFQGRIKPMNTMSLELLRKIYKKDNIKGLNSDQWMISMCYDGWLISNHKISIGWIKIPFIKIGNEIKNTLFRLYNIKYKDYLSIIDIYNIDNHNNKLNFILENECKNAFLKNPSERSKYDNELINLNERINIILGIFQGKYLRIFPEKNNIYGTWTNGYINFEKKNNIKLFNLINNYFYSLYFSQKNNKWNISNNILRNIAKYQYIYGGNLITTKNKIKYEIIYNKLNIFYKCMILYFIISIIFIFIAFYKIFKKNNVFINKLLIISILIELIIFIFHTIGLILRWYISGHAPWSNGYESAVFIAWCSILVGYLFSYNKNPFVFSMTNIISAITLLVAHGNLMDPEITNLVPVLKSYWLMIHVSVITSSYGFLSTGAFLGLIVLILFIIKGPLKKKKIENAIEELTIINEMTTTVGLFLLTIGTFLGAVWANESWGRYWSWDPKETWAFISIIVYTFILHMRLIPKLNNHFIFNLSSLLSISSIIMTYFGVNYYLSGLHSYAKGDPLPIPNWIYISISIILLITIFSYYRNKQIKEINK